MSSSNTTTRDAAVPDVVAEQIAIEQAHVDLVLAELDKATSRADAVHAEGLSRSQFGRSVETGDAEGGNLFERDALVYHAAKRRSVLDTQYEGLVFGRLDLDHRMAPPDGAGAPDGPRTAGSPAGPGSPGGPGTPDGHETRPGPNGTSRADRAQRHTGWEDWEVRYIGRIGVRDDDYEPLVIDWRAPAAEPFYRATPANPMSVIRRRVLRSRGATVIGVEDDLMVPEAPDGLVIVGDGALMAALTRSRGERMRDIVATIQAHQDAAIRASARGVTEITGGPGTGKTVVALHRAAYLLYSDRRRFESGGILVVGPSGAYTAYIERVLPSLGEESVILRAVGDVVDAIDTERLDPPDVARIKGSTRIRTLLATAARGRVPDAPTEFRAFVAGQAIRLDARALDHVRSLVLRQHQRNAGTAAARAALGEAAWSYLGIRGDRDAKAEFLDRWEDHLDVEAFLKAWWPQVDPRDVLLWLTDADLVRRHSRRSVTPDEADLLAASWRVALETGTWSVADVALIDELAARLGPVQDEPEEDRGFYEIEELDNLSQYGVTEVQPVARATSEAHSTVVPDDPRGQLLAGRIDRPDEYAHILVDEAQDLSPMQWRMIGRRGRHASWTVVGDAAQASWPDAAEAVLARDEAFGGQVRRHFHMDTNYRNAREVFDYAADVILREVPDADIPKAVRETGVDPVAGWLGTDAVGAVRAAVDALLDEVEGAIAVITPTRYAAELAPLDGAAGAEPARVHVVDPMSTKGLEYDATVIVDPDEIARESPGGVRVLYVALTRAAHRMTVLQA